MKTLKISLTLIVVAAISAMIFFWIHHLNTIDQVQARGTPFVDKIEQEINQLKAMPENKFCKDYYNEIDYQINEFHKQNCFSKDQAQNNQWKDNFERTLYSVYAEKFINQARTVFLGSEWNTNDLRFIQSEKNELKKSEFLFVGDSVDREFDTIQNVLNKYNEIVSFISSCKDFHFSENTLSDRFPIADVRSKIQRAATLRNNGLENSFVNNCSRLHNELREIPKILFQAHVKYLDSKISLYSGMYSHYNSQIDYGNNLYRPLKGEVEALDNGIYNVSIFTKEYNRLISKLDSDNHEAYKHFTNQQQ